MFILIFVVLFGCGPSQSNDDTVIDTTNLNQNPDRVNKNITEESIKSLSIAEANKLYKQYQNNKILQGNKNKKLVQTLKDKCIDYTKITKVDNIKPELINKPYELDKNKTKKDKEDEWDQYKKVNLNSIKMHFNLINLGEASHINLLNTAIENKEVDINKEWFITKIDENTGKDIKVREYPIEFAIKNELDTMAINISNGFDVRQYLLVNRLGDLILPKSNKDKLINFVQTKIDQIKNTYNHCTNILHIIDKYLYNDIFYNDEKNKYNDVKVTEDEIKNLKLDENNKTFEKKQVSIIELIENLVNNKQITSDLIKNNLGNNPLFYLSEDEDFGNVFKGVGTEKEQYDLRKRLIALFLNQYYNNKNSLPLDDFDITDYYSILRDLLRTDIDYGEVYDQYVYDLFKLFCTSENIHEKMKNNKDEIKKKLKEQIKEKHKQIAYLKGLQEAIKKIKEK